MLLRIIFLPLGSTGSVWMCFWSCRESHFKHRLARFLVPEQSVKAPVSSAIAAMPKHPKPANMAGLQRNCHWVLGHERWDDRIAFSSAHIGPGRSDSKVFLLKLLFTMNFGVRNLAWLPLDLVIFGDATHIESIFICDVTQDGQRKQYRHLLSWTLSQNFHQ